MKALEMLPDRTKLFEVSNFLCFKLRELRSTRWREEVRLNAMRALDVDEQLNLSIERAVEPVVIRSDSLCCRCSKKIRDSVFLRFPNGIVVHQACYGDPTVCPVSGRDFLVDCGPSTLTTS